MLPQDPTRGIRPPTFDGRRENFEAWAFQFEAYGGLLSWTDLVEAAVAREEKHPSMQESWVTSPDQSALQSITCWRRACAGQRYPF